MDRLVAAYVLYLLLSITMTVLVARTLSRHGKNFLAEVFGNDVKLANSVNQLLVVGFYLVSLGFVALWLTTDATVVSARGVFEILSVKLGTVALVLGVMHLANVLLFNAIRRRHLHPAGVGTAPAPTYPTR